jgi:DNA-binding NarL/FixJ family response regulator
MPISIGIVDDSPTIRKVLRGFLETKTNWQICGEAENGEAAVELVQQVHPDLLVLDLSMPVMNGLDAAREIKVISPRTGIVLYTGHASDQLEVAAKAIGIRAVLAKDGPASLDRLFATLGEASQRAA